MPDQALPTIPSRRAVFSVGPDAELLRLCAAFDEANKLMQAAYATGIGDEPGNSVHLAHKAYWAAIKAIEPVRAHSVVGLAAKARVLQADVANTADDEGYEADPPYTPLVMSLLADCIAMGEGVRS